MYYRTITIYLKDLIELSSITTIRFEKEFVQEKLMSNLYLGVYPTVLEHLVKISGHNKRSLVLIVNFRRINPPFVLRDVQSSE